MFGWNFDLHPLACAAYFQFDTPLAARATARHHRACDAAAATVQQFNIVRTEEELRIAIRHILGCQADIAIHQPDLALFDPYRKRAGLADEAIDARGIRIVIDFVGRTDLLDTPLAHHHHAVGELQRLVLIVGHENGRMAGLVVNLAQPTAQFLAHQRIKRAKRFIEKQDFRFNRHGAGKRHALALTTGKLRRIALLQSL